MTNPSDESTGNEADSTDLLGSPVPVSSGNPAKDPEDWVTGDDPMTGSQRSYLDNLARQAGEQLSPDLTKAEASEHIDRLQEKLNQQPTSAGE
ncbi:DUF3072 domain-containing protein [Paenarthrobacter sp. Z7-10]|uniref:DUF3072 domain-containing protein n=1 Tax=Paenarthrobacter sp. Z7-10 TaxID=2787635 RepID=UPI0022A93D91|nr:DUF3072 domain-containing protein [Paenarthrobacter sp. Z7-10]MCZ2402460.1 DUF3072 domain-containing protein [Paenarthrobacter sp. Z7-10]